MFDFNPIRARRAALSLLAAIALLAGCGSDDGGGDDQPTEEYVLDPATLADYRNWNLVGEYERPDNNQFRRVFVNDPNLGAEAPRDGYPVGTIFVKEVSSDVAPADSIIHYQIMVKRGGHYDPAGNDWEYFLTSGENVTNIEGRGRGAELLLGATPCLTCHQNAAGNDMVFFTY